MPFFIDWHEAQHLNDEQQRRLHDRVQSGERDRFGVADRGIVFDRDANRMYCILEAPDEEAIRRHHDAAGVPVEEIHKAEVMLRSL